MRKLGILASGVTLVAMAACHPVFAQQQQNCAERETVIERLKSKYGETRQSIGMAPKGRVVETFASEATGTWTITVTTANGITCLVASGQSYESLNEVVEPVGDDV